MKKLRNGLYSMLNGSDFGSSDYRIAIFLMSNMYKLKSISIDLLAKGSFVSRATVSRFCRRLGFTDYQSMRQTMQVALTGRYRRYDEYIALPKEQMMDTYFQDHLRTVELLRKGISEKMVERLARLLMQYENVGIFGQMHAYAVALNFQMELSSYDKIAHCFSHFVEQEKYIVQNGADTLVIVVSSGGRYFQYFDEVFDPFAPNRPYLVLITNNNRLQNCRPYDEVFVIPSEGNSASRPISLQIFTNLVSMYYGKLLYGTRNTMIAPDHLRERKAWKEQN